VLDDVIFWLEIAWRAIGNHQDKRNRTAFHWAVIGSRHWFIDRPLALPAIDVGLLGCWDLSPLHSTVKNCDSDCVSRICEFSRREIGV
jgi:hypothetical protein